MWHTHCSQLLLLRLQVRHRLPLLCHPAPALPALPAVPFAEMLSAEVLPPLTGMWRLPGTRLHRLVVWTFQRMGHSPAAWQPRQVGRGSRRRQLHALCGPPRQGWLRSGAARWLAPY